MKYLVVVKSESWEEWTVEADSVADAEENFSDGVSKTLDYIESTVESVELDNSIT